MEGFTVGALLGAGLAAGGALAVHLALRRQARSATPAALKAESERRRALEEQLLDSEQALALTLDIIGAALIVTDAHGFITRMNRLAERMTGWSEEEARGCFFWDVYVREGGLAWAGRTNPVDLLLARGVRVEDSNNVTVLARDGTRTPAEARAALNHGVDGQVRGMSMILRDLTLLREAETRLRQMADIVASSNDAIVSKTLDGRITTWNPAAVTLFGYTAEEAIGQPVRMLYPPDRADEEQRIMADVEAGLAVPPFNTVRRRKNGELVEVSISLSPIRDATGRVVGGAKIARDVSLQRKAEQLEAENREILAASRLKTQFVATMSHELRTPLNAIIGFADLLQGGAVPASSSKQQEYLGHIATSGRHLLQLINDVLDLSKVEAGRFRFTPEPLSLTQLAGEVLGVLHTALQRKRLAVGIDVDPAVARVVVDPARLKQVLYNYVSNAIKFTPDGGRITIRARPEGATQFRLEVEDTGIGIAADDLPRLFVEFLQLDAGLNRKHQGTGLGLALTRKLVEAQGGSVGVRSTPGLGSVFHLVLRRNLAGEAPPPAVLVLADSLQAARPLVEGLGALGLQVDTAQGLEDALRLARQRVHDGICLSLASSQAGALATLQGLREDTHDTHAPVLALSLHAPDASSVSFAIADIIAKPLRAGEVTTAVASLPPPVGRALRVLVIDEDAVALTLMRASLERLQVQALCANDAPAALAQLDSLQPDAIIMALVMPELDGLAALDTLQRQPRWRHTPVFLWTGMPLTPEEPAALEQSAEAIARAGGGPLAPVLETIRARCPSPQAPGPLAQ